MKAFLFAVIGALVMAALSGALLSYVQKPTYERYATESARVGDPGHNLLVGERGERHEGANERARD